MEETMNRIKKIFYLVGKNPTVFLLGAFSIIIGLILGLLIFHVFIEIIK